MTDLAVPGRTAVADDGGPEPILHVRDLRVTFSTADGRAPAVRGVDLDIRPGEALAVVGESGSGKSVTMLALLGLLRSAEVTGSARYRGTELVGLDAATLRTIRGNKVAMIFQDPMASLNPVLTIGRQMSMVMRAHQPELGKREARARAVELLDQVAISQASRRFDSYPHELSGGMRQRVMIAMAISNRPEVLIADEPTTALDVTVQAQIMELLDDLRHEHNLAMVLITHDLGVVAGTSDRVTVMYAGRIVESGPVVPVFAAPTHPYTRGLLACLPRLDVRQEVQAAIGGTPVSPMSLPPGCPFGPRCPDVRPECTTAEPALVGVGDRAAACAVHAPETAGE
jgi:oligopeptide/dipeptide ABC transporter ATP-binding protein